MGVTVSHPRSDVKFNRISKQWFCSKCSSSNSTSLHQKCHVCHQSKIKLTLSDKNLFTSMRPMSVSIHHRRQQDELNAEKVFQKTRSYCFQNKICYKDEEFPPSTKSLGPEIGINVNKWLRIRDINLSRTDSNYSWRICSSNPQSIDIEQGQLGDCWLLAALALITERPEMLRHILLTKTLNDQGIYLVRICYNGLWKSVLLDDYFPCTDRNRLAFSKAKKGQLFVPLIEKACAKLFGSYSNLRCGSTAEGLQLLTGAPCHQIDLNPFKKIMDSNAIWNQLLSACQSKLLIGVSTCRSDLKADEYHRVGIAANHAFSLLLATTVSISPYRFLLIRDPHGNTKYSDGSINSLINNQLELVYKTNHSMGIFWISFENFLHYFDSLTISIYRPDSFDIREQAKFTRSSTESVSAYYFHIHKTSTIDISLIYHREDRQQSTYHTQSFVLCDIDEKSKVLGENKIVFESHRGGFLHWSGTLKPAFYVLIPFSISFWQKSSNEKKHANRNFTLVIHSNIQLNGNLNKEPATLLADCLILATMKYCDRPEKKGDSIFYETSHHINSTIIVGENLATKDNLHVFLEINQAKNIHHSRLTSLTIDYIPPSHRQLICIMEWTNKQGEYGQIKYTRSQGFTDEYHNSVPSIDTHKQDLHSPRLILSQ